MDFVIIYRALLRRKWIIAGVTLFAVSLALLLTMNYKETYKSAAQLATGFTEAEQVSVVNERFNLFEADVKFNNLIETINSPKVFSMLAYELFLHDANPNLSPFRTVDDLEKYNEVIGSTSLEELFDYTEIKLDSMEILSSFNPRDNQLKDLLNLYKYDPSSLRDAINIVRVRGTDYVTIEAYSENAELSAFMANTIVEVFLRYRASIQSERTSESADTFAAIVRQKREEMDKKSEELRTFKSSNRVLNFEMESSTIIDQISELEKSRNEYRRNVQGLEYELDDINKRIRNLSQSGPATSNSEINTEIISLREEIAEKNSRFIASGANNQVLLDSLKKLRSELQQKLLQTDVSKSTDELTELIDKRQDKQVELQVAKQDLNSIERNLSILQGSAGGYASKEATIDALERELQMATQEYQSAQEKYNQALDVSLASQSNNIRQILEAQPSDEPEPSKRLIVTALTGASSFFLCIIVIVLLEYMDVSIKSSSNFKRLTDLSLLGSLIETEKEGNELMKALHTVPVPPKLTEFNELLRKLRYELESLGQKKVLVTSTQPDQGKTTFILALSAALSNVNKRVLIVDTHFVNNELTRLLNGAKALESILNKPGKYKEGIRKTSFENVYILGSKGGNYSPSEILDIKSLFELIDQFANEFDYILFEAAPLNKYSDSKELAKFMDGVVCVFSADSVIRQIDKGSVDYIKSLGDKFIGAILNKVKTINIDQ